MTNTPRYHSRFHPSPMAEEHRRVERGVRAVLIAATVVACALVVLGVWALVVFI